MKKNKVKNLISIFLIGVSACLLCFLVSLIVLFIKTDQEKLDLQIHTCQLYKNYETLYLEWDRECSEDLWCNGTEEQKEFYSAYKEWQKYIEEYCPKEYLENR